MPEKGIDEFGRLLVTHVRDVSIQSCDRLLLPSSASLMAKRWQECVSGRTRDTTTTIIPDCVDETIFYLLNAIDQSLLPLRFDCSDGATIDLVKQGQSELAGWYLGTDGWRERFARERFVDYLKDYKPSF